MIKFLKKIIEKIALVPVCWRNRRIVAKYPFLKCYSADPDDFSWTQLDYLPVGWRRVVLDYMKRLRDILVKHNELYNFKIVEVKEKWGVACIYHAGLYSGECDNEVDVLMAELSRETSKICCYCGKPATVHSVGYILPFCDRCARKTKFKVKPLSEN